MSTLAEIEAALPKLSTEELAQVEAALRRLRQRDNSGAAVADVSELERQNGFAVFPERAGGQVTADTVRQLCAEEGV